MTLPVGEMTSGDVSPPLVLASGSVVRARLLKNAGLDFSIDVADVDEASIKTGMQAKGAPANDIAAALAEQKARAVSRRQPGAYVIGADQILELGPGIFDKPANMATARNHLQRLRGQPHCLVTAVCVMRDDEVVWQHVAVPRLTMRDFSDDFLEEYLAASGEKILSSVGAYLLEDRGAQLFSDIEGDYFSILGLPLLPLLAFLRGQGIGAE
jgi:septum formation protein